MIKLVTAFLTLGVSTAIAMTAIAQRGWWVGCDPEVDWCRLISGSRPTTGTRSRPYPIRAKRCVFILWEATCRTDLKVVWRGIDRARRRASSVAPSSSRHLVGGIVATARANVYWPTGIGGRGASSCVASGSCRSRSRPENMPL